MSLYVVVVGFFVFLDFCEQVEQIIVEVCCQGVSVCEVVVLLEQGLFISVCQGEVEIVEFNCD